MKLFKERSRLNISKYFFSNRIVDRWNGLPEYVINADSTNSFKNRLDNYWKMTGCGYLQRPLSGNVKLRQDLKDLQCLWS